MKIFRNPMVGLSVIPVMPILFVGAFIMFSVIGNEKEFKVFLSIWLFGLAGSIGLIMASFESTYSALKNRMLTICLVLCGFIAIFTSCYYAINLQEYSYHPSHGVGVDDLAHDKIIYGFFIIWLLLVWPFFSGIIAIRHCLTRPSI